MTEYELMMMCMGYCERNDIYVLHIDNESGTASRRALGMRRGVPDLMLVGMDTVMFSELKKNESLLPSPDQQLMINNINKHGIPAACCGSYESFKKFVEDNDVYADTWTGLGDLIRVDEYKRGGDIARVSKFYIDTINADDSPYDLFAIKFNTAADSNFPWLIDLASRTFVATSNSKVVRRLLNLGWDVILI